ncbi:DUF3263 domain-containing protein [Rhodococcus sp. ZPP]|uniref:DUF3263 domain-containing protein n=1 Tax=Rhodococcus sp. ZPP TaxID=2749906 RepID=UPI001AD894E3|nr:DUF3263 domain-containing protein [Rhodococcus sp. ZPP]QTJ67155.1 DUF3263 domain-containing protein [Rhodococcus sp. ZPP]
MSNRSIIEDSRILEFARRWLPYGGGNTGDLLVEFGMTPAGYIARLGEILDGPAGWHLDPQLRADLRSFVDTRIQAVRTTAQPNTRT